MIIKSRLRLPAVLVSGAGLILLGIASVFICYLTIFRNSESFSISDLIGPFFGLFFLYLTYSAISSTIIIIISESERTVEFRFLFKFSSKTYNFSDIITTKTSELRSIRGPVWKGFKIETADGKKYQITDFETANLRQLQGFFLDTFHDTQSKKEQLLLNNAVDKAQKNDVLIFLLILFAFLLYCLYNIFFKNEMDVFIYPIAIIEVWLLTKYFRLKKTIVENEQEISSLP